jgi:hypothetical protein
MLSVFVVIIEISENNLELIEKVIACALFSLVQ